MSETHSIGRRALCTRKYSVSKTLAEQNKPLRVAERRNLMLKSRTARVKIKNNGKSWRQPLGSAEKAATCFTKGD